MDHPFEIREILAAYFSLLPEKEIIPFSLAGARDAEGLSARWEEVLTGDTKEDVIGSFGYYRALMAVQRERACALSYNETTARIYPFVVGRIFELFPREVRTELLAHAHVPDITGLARAMVESPALRNAFRRAFQGNISGPILSFLYSMVYLMGFSSGGEASFLRRVFGRVKEWKGHLLDAGGGSGFAGLVVSTRGPVTYIDFSPFRARRAGAIAAASRHDESFFYDMLDLIDEESAAFGLVLDRSLIPRLSAGPVSYRSADLSHLSGDLGPFDGAMLTDVLEHTTDPEGVVVSVGRTLRSGAPILITVPTDANGIVGRLREQEEGYTFPFLLHIEFFSDERIGRMAERAGFSVEELSYFSYEKTTCLGPAPMEVMAMLRKK